MVKIDVKLDDRALREMKKAQEKYGEKVVQRAERDAAKKARTAMKEAILERYNVHEKEIKELLVAKGGELYAESRKFTVGTDTHFSHTPKEYKSQEKVAVKRRKKATVTIFKGKENKKKYSHAFILNPEKVKNGPKTMLWEREGNQPPEPVRSTSVAEMANQWQIRQKAEKTMSRTFENRLHHHIDREMSKIANH